MTSSLGTASRDIKVAIDKINANINWMKRTYKSLSKLLDTNISIGNLNWPFSAFISVVIFKTHFKIESTKKRSNDTKLPKDVMPYLYEIQLKPYIGLYSQYGNKSFTFDGKVKIYFTCEKETNEIILHYKDLNLLHQTLNVNSSTDAEFSYYFIEWKNDYEKEFFIMSFARQCKKGHNYTLSIGYTGPISSRLDGLYRSAYFDPLTNQTE